MTQMSEFIARENIRRFKAQLLEGAEGIRKTTIRQLLCDEQLHLHVLTGNE
jgi:hypothetical protein